MLLNRCPHGTDFRTEVRTVRTSVRMSARYGLPYGCPHGTNFRTEVRTVRTSVRKSVQYFNGRGHLHPGASFVALTNRIGRDLRHLAKWTWLDLALDLAGHLAALPKHIASACSTLGHVKIEARHNSQCRGTSAELQILEVAILRLQRPQSKPAC